MKHSFRYGPFLLLATIAAVGLLWPSLAQSPTMAILRLINAPEKSRSTQSQVVRGTLSSRGGRFRSLVIVRARTAPEARRVATRYTCARAVKMVAVPLKEFEGLRDALAEVTAELKATREALQAKIVAEKKTPEGYSIEVELAQDPAALAQDFQAGALSNFRLVALLPEAIDGRRMASPKVETALVGALAAQQFRVYDWNFVAARKPLASLVAATLSKEPTATARLGTRFLANVIVAGRVDARFSQDNDGIISYLATANLRVIKVDTGQILTAKEWSEKGFGQDRAQAARKALEALAATVAKELPAELLAHAEEYPVTVQLPLAGPEQAGEVESLLRHLTGVLDVRREESLSGLSFRVTTREKPAMLGAQILQGQRYALAE